jgi:hypothetical protein
MHMKARSCPGGVFEGALPGVKGEALVFEAQERDAAEAEPELLAALVVDLFAGAALEDLGEVGPALLRGEAALQALRGADAGVAGGVDAPGLEVRVVGEREEAVAVLGGGVGALQALPEALADEEVDGGGLSGAARAQVGAL